MDCTWMSPASFGKTRISRLGCYFFYNAVLVKNWCSSWNEKDQYSFGVPLLNMGQNLRFPQGLLLNGWKKFWLNQIIEFLQYFPSRVPFQNIPRSPTLCMLGFPAGMKRTNVCKGCPLTKCWIKFEFFTEIAFEWLFYILAKTRFSR